MAPAPEAHATAGTIPGRLNRTRVRGERQVSGIPDRLDRPTVRVTLALAAGAAGAALLPRWSALTGEASLNVLGGLTAVAGSLASAFILTAPLLARDRGLRPLASVCAQAGSGWLMTLAVAGLGYLVAVAFPRAAPFIACTGVALGAMALRDGLRVLFRVAATEEP